MQKSLFSAGQPLAKNREGVECIAGVPAYYQGLMLLCNDNFNLQVVGVNGEVIWRRVLHPILMVACPYARDRPL